MAARRADARSARPRPRPGTETRSGTGGRRPDGSLARREYPTRQQMAATAGTAIVTAARVGRLLGRAGWRMARQLPGVSLVEQAASQVRRAAADELLRLLEMPPQAAPRAFRSASPDEQRVMMLVQDADSDPAPLRTAMSELLGRASTATASGSRDYLFGTIVSQLVPDEARLLAVLADGKPRAAVDVVAKSLGRSPGRPVLANASRLGAAARITPPRSTATYLTRLHGFGLVEFGPELDELSAEYDKLAVDAVVQEARARIDRNRMGSAKLLRKSVALSQLGREFWAACAPDPETLGRLHS